MTDVKQALRKPGTLMNAEPTKAVLPSLLLDFLYVRPK